MAFIYKVLKNKNKHFTERNNIPLTIHQSKITNNIGTSIINKKKITLTSVSFIRKTQCSYINISNNIRIAANSKMQYLYISTRELNRISSS